MNHLRIHRPDTCHSWGIEFNFGTDDKADAVEFVSICRSILWNKKVFPKGIWFHQCGSDTAPQYHGYQFFEYWGPEPENTVHMAASFISQKLNCINEGA